MKPVFDAESRAATHRLVDLIFDHLESVDERGVVDWTDLETLQQSVRLDPAPEPESIDDLAALYLAKSIQLHHRAYMGHQVCPPFAPAVAADLLISAMNQSTAVWEMSPLATAIERELVRWLVQRVGYHAETAAGTAVSGGTAANLTALLAARARWQHDNPGGGRRPVIVCSADAHYSVTRAAAIMGMNRADVIDVPTDEHHRLDLDQLAATLEALADSDASVFAIVATSGSTAAGAFDRLHEVADVRDRYRTWLHVDAAHGASAILSPRLHHLVAGLERADSLGWDPHKMMWMPLSLGIVLVREGRWLRAAFDSHAPYLFHRDARDRNLGELTIQCSRRADAVKLWLTLKAVGVAPIVAALDHVTAVTRELSSMVSAADDFVAMHEPQFNIFCFRYLPYAETEENEAEIDAVNEETRQRLLESGEAWITATTLKGKRVLRVTIINPKTQVEDVEKMLGSVRRIGREVAARRSVVSR